MSIRTRSSATPDGYNFNTFTAHWGGQHYTDDRRAPIRLYLAREPLNRGGYTSRGEYFGTGAPLFRVDSADDATVHFYIRARDRDAAKAIIRVGYPNARFGR